MTFSKLTTAMSLLSDAEGVRSQNTVIQSFSDKAVEQLTNAFGGTPAGGVMPTTPGPGASKTPEQIKQEQNRARTKSSVGSMIP
jgi:hypothetical protein